MAWTQFWDMHSGGYSKISDIDKIYIEADGDEAIELFKRIFERDPGNVTCDCCGEDFSVCTESDIAELTRFNRTRHWTDSQEPPLSLEEYMKLSNVLFIDKNKIAELLSQGNLKQFQSSLGIH